MDFQNNPTSPQSVPAAEPVNPQPVAIPTYPAPAAAPVAPPVTPPVLPTPVPYSPVTTPPEPVAPSMPVVEPNPFAAPPAPEPVIAAVPAAPFPEPPAAVTAPVVPQVAPPEPEAPAMPVIEQNPFAAPPAPAMPTPFTATPTAPVEPTEPVPAPEPAPTPLNAATNDIVMETTAAAPTANSQYEGKGQGRYKVVVIPEKCIGAASCVAVAAKTFKLNDQQIAEVLSSVNQETDENLLLAAQSCPTLAIEVYDTTTGEKVWPK